VQSSSQIVTTNKPTSSFFTGRMPTNSVKALKGNQIWDGKESKILASCLFWNDWW